MNNDTSDAGESLLRDIYFTCLRCGAGTQIYREIVSHMKTCVSLMGVSPIRVPCIDLLAESSNAEIKGSPQKKRPLYRTLKGIVDIVEEDSVESEPLSVEEDILLHKAALQGAEDHFLTVTALTKPCPLKALIKAAQPMKRQRLNVLPFVTVREYVSILERQTSYIEKELAEVKAKMTFSIRSKVLNPLDLRLDGGKIGNIPIEAEEVEAFKCSLLREWKGVLEPFCLKTCISRVLNFGVALFSLDHFLKICLVSPHKKHNVVFIDIGKEATESKEKYSFYTLESINKDKKRCWKMDCRLMSIAEAISENLRPYILSILRRSYFREYHDNIFRKDYMPCNEDLTLAKNLYSVSNVGELSSILRRVIISDCVLKPTENDKVNIYSDDPLQKKKTSRVGDVVDTIKELFDGINSEDAVAFYHRTKPQ